MKMLILFISSCAAVIPAARAEAKVEPGEEGECLH